VVRSPMREAGAEFVKGRTSPTMTYMSGVQVPGATPPTLLVAALAPITLRIAGELADGTVTWMTGVKTIETSAADLAKIRKIHWEEGTKTFLISRSPKYGQQLKDAMAKFAPK